MSNGNGAANGVAVDGGDGNGGTQTETIDIDAMVEDAVERHHEATKDEAGRPEGRLVPALVLGPQRYPDPSIYDPGITESLTIDEDYGETVRFLLDVARDPDLAPED